MNDELRDRINAHPIHETAAWCGMTHGKDSSRSNPTWVCPQCGRGHKTGIWAIKAKNKLYCRVCREAGRPSAFDCIGLIMLSHACEYLEALKLGAGMLGIPYDDNGSSAYRHTAPRQTPQNAPQRTERDEPVPDYTDVLKRAQAALTDDSAGAVYLRSRGLNVDVARAAGIGYAPEWRHHKAGDGVPTSPRITIPMDTGGYEARDIRTDDELRRLDERDGGERLRYKKQSTGNKGLFNVNALDGTAPVHIVEGWADALAVICAGGEAVALNCTGGKERLVERLDAMDSADIPPLILALDVDTNNAGQNAQADLAAQLDRRHIPYAIGTICLTAPNNPKETLDPADSHHLDPPAFAHRVHMDMRDAVDSSKFRSRDCAVPVAGDAHRGSHPTGENGARILRAEGAATYGQTGYVTDVDAVARYRNRRTGFANLDAFGPFYPGFYCVGAITSLGKTTFCAQWADALATRGEHVLYISIEQDRRIMHSKSVARYAYRLMGDAAPSGTDIATGVRGGQIDDAHAMYREDVGDRLMVIAETQVRPMDIDATVRDYADRCGCSPTVFVDYVQRLMPDDRERDVRIAMNHATEVFQKLVNDIGATVVVVSSINRASYLQPIAFESMKESGGLEYTADCFYGLELGCMRAPMFGDERGVVQKRNIIRAAKLEIPREVRLVCLKNRLGPSSFEALFHYWPNHEYYEALTVDDSRVLCDGGDTIDFKPPSDRSTWRDLLKPGSAATTPWMPSGATLWGGSSKGNQARAASKKRKPINLGS